MSTIKDVAERAGVSSATVSRVINNASNVSPKTVEKVHAAIKELNFIPNFIARNLKTEQTRTIGFLISNIENSYFAVMAKVLETEFQKIGYDMLICSTDDDGILERKYLNYFLSNQVAGIILNTTGKNNEFVKDISQIVPLVLVERSIDLPGFKGDYVGANNRAGICELTQFLLEKGHRNIGIVNGNRNVSTGRERFRGFVDAMRSYHMEIDEHYPYIRDTSEFSEKEGYDAAKALMSMEVPPTAIIACNNTMTVGVYKYLKKNGISIPGKVSVAGYGNIENSELFFVEPAYVTLNPKSIGEKAFRYLSTRMDQKEINNREAIFEPQLYEGESIRNIS